MKKIYDDFEKNCAATFKFLEHEFEFKLVGRERHPFGVYLTYENRTTAVRVSFEPRDGGIFVLLSRLLNGKIPEYPIFVKADTILNSFYLDDLITLRAPHRVSKQQLAIPCSLETLKAALQEAAQHLREHGEQVLKGDFEVFSDLERIVKRRLR